MNEQCYNSILNKCLMIFEKVIKNLGLKWFVA